MAEAGYSASNAAAFGDITMGGNSGPQINFGSGSIGAPPTMGVPLWAWIVGGVGLLIGAVVMFRKRG